MCDEKVDNQNRPQSEYVENKLLTLTVSSPTYFKHQEGQLWRANWKRKIQYVSLHVEREKIGYVELMYWEIC